MLLGGCHHEVMGGNLKVRTRLLQVVFEMLQVCARATHLDHAVLCCLHAGWREIPALAPHGCVVPSACLAFRPLVTCLPPLVCPCKAPR